MSRTMSRLRDVCVSHRLLPWRWALSCAAGVPMCRWRKLRHRRIKNNENKKKQKHRDMGAASSGPAAGA